MYLPQGTELNHRYVIESLLGHGGFGITYAAHDTTLNVRWPLRNTCPAVGHPFRRPDKVSVFTGEARQHYDYGLGKFLEEAQSVAASPITPMSCPPGLFHGQRHRLHGDGIRRGGDFKGICGEEGGRISFEEAKAL